MLRGLKLAHFGGLVMFLGSVITFVVDSTLIDGASLENIAFGRKVISTGTKALTLSGIWVLAVTGVWMGYIQYGLKQRFFQLKLLFIVLIVVNAHVFIKPAVTLATELAVRSLAQGRLLPEYNSTYVQESAFGAVNVVLTVAAAVIGVWKVGAKSTANG